MGGLPLPPPLPPEKMKSKRTIYTPYTNLEDRLCNMIALFVQFNTETEKIPGPIQGAGKREEEKER